MQGALHGAVQSAVQSAVHGAVHRAVHSAVHAWCIRKACLVTCLFCAGVLSKLPTSKKQGKPSRPSPALDR